MLLRPALKMVVQLGLVISIAVFAMTFGTGDAEARRGGKVRSSKEHSTPRDSSESSRKSQDDAADGASSSTPIPGVRVRSREASRSDTATDANTPARRRSSARRAAAIAPEKDIDVPGCPTGMICTVCLAGCGDGANNVIVDAQPKTPIPTARR